MARPPKSRSTPPPVEAGSDTRSRVLQLAWNLIAERGDAGITLVDVARAAGLSRQMLYLLFGSRAGLLVAMVEHADHRSAAGERLARARSSVRPDSGFEPYVRAWLDYLPAVFPVARALEAAATLGDREAAIAWDSRMDLLRAGFLQVAQALEVAGALREGWTAAAAAQWAYNLTHVDSWQHLVVEGRWRPADAADRIVAALRDTLLRAGGPAAIRA